MKNIDVNDKTILQLMEEYNSIQTLNEFLLTDIERYEKEIGDIETAKSIFGHNWRNLTLLTHAINGNSSNPQDIKRAAAARMISHYLQQHPEEKKAAPKSIFVEGDNDFDWNDLADKIWRFTYQNREPISSIMKIAHGFLWSIIVDLKYNKLWNSRIELADAMMNNTNDHTNYFRINRYLISKGF